jgi:hypothetical protein
MGSVAVGHGPAAGRKVERRIDGHERGPGVPNITDDFLIGEKKPGDGSPSDKTADAARTARNASQVDAHHRKLFSH